MGLSEQIEMRILDRVLQNWRARHARRWILNGARVLDIGCYQGGFLLSLSERIGPSFGLDPLATPRVKGYVRIVLKRTEASVVRLTATNHIFAKGCSPESSSQ